MQSMSLSSIAIALVAVVVAFLVLREVVLWYFNISKITFLLEKQNDLLSDLIRLSSQKDDECKDDKHIGNVNEKKNESIKDFLVSTFKIKRCPECNRANKSTADVCSGCGAKI